jgi:hypothetical protein
MFIEHARLQTRDKRLYAVKHLHPIPMFVSKAGAYQCGAPGSLKLELERLDLDGNA